MCKIGEILPSFLKKLESKVLTSLSTKSKKAIPPSHAQKSRNNQRYDHTLKSLELFKIMIFKKDK